MLPVFESKRLVILPWITEVDGAEAFTIDDNCNFEYSYNTDYNLRQANIETMQKSAHKDINKFNKLKDGKGFWAILEKKSQQLIGGILIKKLYDINENPTSNYEIAWHIHQEYWGEGYAIEAALVVINYGLNTLNLPALIAIIDPNNTASLKVAKKLGMISLGITNNYYTRGQELFYIKSDGEYIF